MAVLGALLATVLLSALGLAVAFLGIEETTLASRERTIRSLRLAAEAAAQLAVVDLEAVPLWDDVLVAGASAGVSSVRTRFSEATPIAPAPWGRGSLDLRTITASLQAESDATRGPADAAQHWRLLGQAPFARVVADAPPWYVAVWVADDRADTDGDPDRDANGTVAIHAVALGPSDASAAIDILVHRDALPGGPGPLRVVSIRPRS